MISIESQRGWHVTLDSDSGILKLTDCQSYRKERLCKSLNFIEVFLGRSARGDDLKCGNDDEFYELESLPKDSSVLIFSCAISVWVVMNFLFLLEVNSFDPKT